jgi:hypothetical protein
MNKLVKLFMVSNIALQQNTPTGFTEKKIYTKSFILENDKIGCNQEIVTFHKEMLMNKYQINEDYLTVTCKSIVDYKGDTYTKWYKEIKL